MTESEFRSFLLFAAILATVIGVVNMLRPNRRWLGAGGVLLGVSALLYALGVSMPAVAVVCGLGVFALMRDVIARSGRAA